MSNDHNDTGALKILRAFCPPHLLEEIEGDLLQKFERDVKLFGEGKAKRRLLWNVVRFFRPGILLRKKNSKVLRTDLLISDFTLALRQFKKQPVFSVMHIASLGIGISIIIVLASYLSFQLGFDRFHPDYQDTYRINLLISKSGKLVNKGARTAPAFAEKTKDIPEVASFTRAVLLGEAIVGYHSNLIREKDILLADERHLQFYNYQIIAGHSDKMLREPLSVLLSQSMASRLFGEEDPTGKTIQITSENFDGAVDFVVNGVYKDQREDSHLRPQMLISYSTLYHFIGEKIDQSWDWLNLYTYVQLQYGVDVSQVEEKLNQAIIAEQGEALKSKGEEWRVELQPVQEIHSNVSYTGEFEPGVEFMQVLIVCFLVIFVTIITFTNSVNLTIYNSLQRIKEIGIRKAHGAFRSQIVTQVLIQSFVTNFAGVTFAVIIFIFSLPFLTDFFPVLHGALQWENLCLLFLAILFIGTFLSGGYPAFISSGHRPAEALHQLVKGKGGFYLRRTLLVFQLAVSSMLVIGSLVINKQLQFMNSHDLGFNSKNKLVIRTAGMQQTSAGSKVQIFLETLRQQSFVKEATTLNEIPGNEIYWKVDDVHVKNKKSSATFSLLSVGDRYFETLDIAQVSGRSFKGSVNHQQEVVINESALTMLGFKNAEEATGAMIQLGNKEVEIVGVVSDFHQQGLAHKLEPTIFRNSADVLNYFVVDFTSGKDLEAISRIGELYKQVFTDFPYESFVLQDYFNNQYRTEINLGRISQALTLFSLLLTVVGIASFSLQSLASRTKEVSIRKVLGANAGHLIVLMGKEYFVMSVISLFLGLPFSYWIFSSWLERFSFRIDIGWGQFLFPVFIVLVVAASSVSLQIIRAAMVNPSDQLKHD